jgi:hypothetical protein
VLGINSLAAWPRPDYAAPEVPDFPNLPAILRWEISLALVMLAWSLLSLGRYERLKRRWSRRRGTPAKVIHLPGATISPPPSRPRSRWVIGRRWQRLKLLAAAAGFASVAASVAYAMPTIVHLERPDVPRRTQERATQELDPPAQPRHPEPPPPERDSAAPESAPVPREDATDGPERRPSIEAELTVTAEPPAGTSTAAPTPEPSPSTGAPVTPPSPDPSANPSPTPDVTPSLLPSAPGERNALAAVLGIAIHSLANARSTGLARKVPSKEKAAERFVRPLSRLVPPLELCAHPGLADQGRADGHGDSTGEHEQHDVAAGDGKDGGLPGDLGSRLGPPLLLPGLDYGRRLLRGALGECRSHQRHHGDDEEGNLGQLVSSHLLIPPVSVSQFLGKHGPKNRMLQ